MCKRWVMAVVAVGVLATTSLASAAGISWRSDIKAALDEAAKTNRLVMIDFYDTDCSWCDKMDKETLTSADVISATEGIIPVRVDVDKSPDVASPYDLKGVPSFIFVDSSGAEAGRIEGYTPPGPFIEQMKAVVAEQDKLVALKAAIAKDPNDNNAKADLVRIYLNRRQGSQAAPLVDALAALPKDKAPTDMADMLLNTAIAFGSAGDNDKALTYLSKVTSSYPGTEQAEWASFFTGLALGLKGDREAAIKQLEMVLQTVKSDDVKERARSLLERFKEGPAVPTL